MDKKKKQQLDFVFFLTHNSSLLHLYDYKKGIGCFTATSIAIAYKLH